MKEKIEKRINDVKEARKIMQQKMAELKKNEAELMNQFIASNGALQELETILKECGGE